MRSLRGGCFAAGTPLLTPDGSNPNEQFVEGDDVLSLHEDDPHSVPYPRRVVSLFVSTSTLLEIGIGGRAIRTTAEHPFWVKDRGWIAAQHIKSGDELWTRDGRWLAVDSLQVLIGSATVYNVEIEE